MMGKSMFSSRQLIAVIVVMAALALLPMVFGNYARYATQLTMVYAVSAIGLNLALGLAAVYSFGHGGFMLIGAYITAIAMAKFGLPYWIAPFISLPVAGLIGAALGLPSFRLSGFALAIVTFAFAASIFQAVQSIEYLGGATGMSIPRSTLPKNAYTLYYMCLLWLLVSVAISFSIATSKTGRALKCLGSNEIVARGLGINVNRYKIVIFTLSAAFGGLSGSLLAMVTAFVAPETYSPDLSVEIFAAVMIGGAGSPLGPVVGAMFIVLVPEIVQAGSNLSQVVFAAIFLAIATLLPKGLAGVIRQIVSFVSPSRTSQTGVKP